MSIYDSARDLGKLLQVLHVDACFVGPSGCSLRHAFDSIDVGDVIITRSAACVANVVVSTTCPITRPCQQGCSL